MSGLTILCLRFTVKALDAIEFGRQSGAQLRGALYDALRAQSCTARHGNHDPEQAQWCPVCKLMAREDPTAQRGKDVPRAFAIQPPPSDTQVYMPGDPFIFGVSLFGDAVDLFPYLVLAVPLMGRHGIGHGRGRFSLCSITAHHPLTGALETLMGDGEQQVQRPSLMVNAQSVSQAAAGLPTDHLSLLFLTPTRLTENGLLVHQPYFDVLMARLLERYDVLCSEYAPETQHSPHDELVEHSRTIRLVRDNTHWVDIFSGSRRRGNITPISGFVGEAEYVGDLTAFREWLLWGQCIQIGKNAVKGNGVYKILR